jgi:hypothetical protein
VLEYNRLVAEVKVRRERLKAISPAVTAFVTSLPAQSLPFPDGKLKVLTTEAVAVISRSLVRECLGEIMHSKLDGKQSHAQIEHICNAMTAHICARRTRYTRQRLTRTWSSAAKTRTLSAMLGGANDAQSPPTKRTQPSPPL